MAANIWIVYAMLATVFWGMNCAFTEKLLEKGFPVSVLIALESCLALPIFLSLSLYKGYAKQAVDMALADKALPLLMFFVAATFITASFFINHSIQAKNATLAGLLEVSYPVFTILFTWVFYREMHLNLYSGIGGILILSGIFVIYLKG